MNNELQKRLYEMEVMPPDAAWAKLSVSIDEINADNAIAMKLSSAEILPPASLWEKVSMSIDEINSDNIIAKKISAAETLPPTSVWEKIKNSIGITEEVYPEKKVRVINFRRLAAAAVFVGVIVAAWLLLRNNNTTTERLAEVPKPAENPITKDTNTTVKKDEPLRVDELPTTSTAIASVNVQALVSKSKRNNSLNRSNKTNAAIQASSGQLATLIHNAPGEKSFDKPIDDLSLVTASENYMTMVNANGRLVKIPAELAQLAPHLQDKPLTEDIYEIMFGEGTYWKETLNEWRKKVISLPVTSGDAFNSFIELLKTVQDK